MGAGAGDPVEQASDLCHLSWSLDACPATSEAFVHSSEDFAIATSEIEDVSVRADRQAISQCLELSIEAGDVGGFFATIDHLSDECDEVVDNGCEDDREDGEEDDVVSSEWADCCRYWWHCDGYWGENVND